MTAEDYVEQHTRNDSNKLCPEDGKYGEAVVSYHDWLTQDKALEAVDMAKREIAWEIHGMISQGKSIAEIDHYVCSICDF